MTKRKKQLYEDMTPDERERAVRMLMAAGGSNGSVAQDLGTTSGTIAGIRDRKGIPSLHKPGFADVKKGSSGVPLKIASSEATQCAVTDERGKQCAYEHLPDSAYCGLPQHQALKPKERARH